MASGLSFGFGGFGGILSVGASGVGAFGAGSDTLGSFIREAQLDDFFYSFGGPDPKPRAIPITTSRELPGSTHWDPAPIPVGKPGGGSPSDSGVVYEEGGILSVLGLPPLLPDFTNKEQPPIIYSPPPILLPGQTDPGREERETEESEVAHTWTHTASQFIGALFPSSAVQQSFVAGPGQAPLPGTVPFTPGVPTMGASQVYSGGTCPPAKTRTLTIDCATGQEVKRKRRRRRALLTQGDMGVLFQIASLPNNANVRVALAGAIRR